LVDLPMTEYCGVAGGGEVVVVVVVVVVAVVVDVDVSRPLVPAGDPHAVSNTRAAAAMILTPCGERSSV
jgi:hypothetical protein